jgi:hypothetical protein
MKQGMQGVPPHLAKVPAKSFGLLETMAETLGSPSALGGMR